jgi:DinB superfamily
MKRMLFAWLFIVWAPTAFGQVLTSDEKKFVIDMLNENSKRFLAAIENVNELQWTYKPTSASWSIAEVSEHIVLSDGLLLSIAQRSLKSPGDSLKGVELQGKEDVVIAKLKDRTYRANAPESLKPTNKFATKKELIDAFKETRERTGLYVATTNDSLKDHIAPHPLFGELTTYQWLVMIPAHANRHVDQLEEVKIVEDFPLK